MWDARRDGRRRPRAPHQPPHDAGGRWRGSTRTSRTVSHSDYEFTLTFSRVDHEVEDEEVPGVVVTRVIAVPQADARADRRDGGQLVQVADPGGHQEPARRSGPARTTVNGRAPGRSAPSSSGACRAGRCCQRGGSRVADVLERDPALEVDQRVGLVGELEREGVGAALDRARELVGDRSSSAGRDAARARAPRRAPAWRSRRASRSPAAPRRASPNGATISAVQSSPRGTSR